MASKREQQLIDRLEASGYPVHHKQTDAPFSFMIRPFTTEGVPSSELAASLEDAVFAQISKLSFASPITGILIFPTIFDVRVATPPADYVKFKRNDKSVFVGTVIEYGAWVSSSQEGRLQLLASNVKTSIERIPNRHLTETDRQKLLSEVDKCVLQLARRLLL